MLVSAVSGEKIVPETFENIFFHNTLKKDFQMYFPNITGIILDGTQIEKVWDIFNLLTQKWKYMPKSEDIQSIRASFQKHYSHFYVDMFDSILNYQMNEAKNDKTIQDIIRESKELADRRLQDGINIIKNNIVTNCTELKMYMNASAVKKRYWRYKLLRLWSKRYKQKYEDIKPLYKRIKKSKI